MTAWITAWKKEKTPGLFTAPIRICCSGCTCASQHHLVGPTVCKLSCPRDRLMLLQLLGSFVLLLDGTTPFRSIQLADEVWKSLDAETESTVILFDSAKTDSVVSQKQITAPLPLHPAFPDQLF